MKNLCYLYIRNASLIGVNYCAIPSLAWFVAMIIFVPFRTVYILRLLLSLSFGCAIAAFLNRKGLMMWLAKHCSPMGPATVIDGTLIGASIGVGSALLPVLTCLILTNHPEMAKTFIIVVYLSSALVGGIFGSVFAVIGRKHINVEDDEFMRIMQ